MALTPTNGDTAEIYINPDGDTYLYVKPKWGSMKMQASYPGPLYAVDNGTWELDGLWHEPEMPLSIATQGSMEAKVADMNSRYFLIETEGPVLDSGSSYLPTRYRSVSFIPQAIQESMTLLKQGFPSFSRDRIGAYETAFWGKHNKTAWKYCKRVLPKDIPAWELKEAEAVFNSNTKPMWMAAVSLAASRRHFFEQRQRYNQYILGREETDEERSERLEYGRDTRMMAAFYRAFTGGDGKSILLRKSKIPAAVRLAGKHDAGYKRLMTDLEERFESVQGVVHAWTRSKLNSN